MFLEDLYMYSSLVIIKQHIYFVIDEPHCKKGYEDVRVGVIPYETIIAQCVVDSVPPVNRFFWTYNTSKGVFPVQGAKIQNKGNVSVVHFPADSEDVRSLQCWAENDMGKQETPCYFHVVSAGMFFNKNYILYTS